MFGRTIISRRMSVVDVVETMEVGVASFKVSKKMKGFFFSLRGA